MKRNMLGFLLVLLFFPACHGETKGDQESANVKIDATNDVGVNQQKTSKEHLKKLPERTQDASVALRALQIKVHGKDKAQREEAIGTLLRHVAPSSNKKTVELWLGKASKEQSEAKIGGDQKRVFATYYCRLPDRTGTQLMTVHYEKRNGEFTVVDVKGPHFPDE